MNNALFIENKRKQFRPFDTYAIIKNINVIYSKYKDSNMVFIVPNLV